MIMSSSGHGSESGGGGTEREREREREREVVCMLNSKVSKLDERLHEREIKGTLRSN